MPANEFRRSVSVDFVSNGSLCEWCGKLAERQITAIGGRNHNGRGVFCYSCGEKFTEAVARPSVVVSVVEMNPQ